MKKSSKNKKVTFSFNEKEADSKINTNTIKKFDKENLIVAVRVRALNTKEFEFSNLDAIKIKNNELVTVLDPLEHLGKSDDIKNKREQQYAFDFAFDKNTTQEEVYTNTAKFLLDGVIEGYNATVFAYGATGAGKTYTMVGTGENPGVMVRSLNDLFSLIQMQKDKAIKIHISYVEIYNECLKDLLVDADGLKDKDIDIREDPINGITLVGVNEVIVTNVSEVFKMLIKGNKNRREEATVHNENSSRSHAILQVNIQLQDKVTGLDNQITVGKFVLVDLAGSERVSNTNTTGMRLLESGNINKSLLALGNCINCLVDGGNSRIVMIANISPSILTIEETVNTLKYANRAKNIKIKIKKNIVENSHHISKYDEIIESFKSEIEELKAQVTKKESEESILHLNLNQNNESGNLGKNKEIIEKIKNILSMISNHFQEEIKLRKDIIEAEKIVENSKIQIAEKEFELYKSTNKKEIENIKKLMKSFNSEKEKSIIKLNEKYINQSLITKKRSDIQSQITKFSKEHPSSLKILMNTYKYYSSLLENMILDHRKNLKFNEIKIKDYEIEKLIDQIKIRDSILTNYETEIKNKKFNLKLNNTHIKSLQEIDAEPINLPVILSKYQSFKSSNLAQNNTSLEEKKKTPIQPKHRTYEHELSPLMKKNKVQAVKLGTKSNIKLNNSKSMDRSNRSHDSSFNKSISNENKNANLHIDKDEAQDKIFYVNSNLGKNMKFNLQKLKYLIANQIDNYEEPSNIQEKTNPNMNTNLNKSFQSNTSTSRLEKEMQRKVKTILKRDILGRYRKSPYLKSI